MAERARLRLDQNLRLIEQGRLVVSVSVDDAEILLFDGKFTFAAHQVTPELLGQVSPAQFKGQSCESDGTHATTAVESIDAKTRHDENGDWHRSEQTSKPPLADQVRKAPPECSPTGSSPTTERPNTSGRTRSPFTTETPQASTVSETTSTGPVIGRSSNALTRWKSSFLPSGPRLAKSWASATPANNLRQIPKRRGWHLVLQRPNYPAIESQTEPPRHVLQCLCQSAQAKDGRVDAAIDRCTPGMA